MSTDDVAARIRASLLADALATFRSGDAATHYANCVVRYAATLKAVLDECETRSTYIKVEVVEAAIARALEIK